jgi:hypothetical protein
LRERVGLRLQASIGVTNREQGRHLFERREEFGVAGFEGFGGTDTRHVLLPDDGS